MLIRPSPSPWRKFNAAKTSPPALVWHYLHQQSHNEIVSIVLMALLSPRVVRKEGEMLTLIDFQLCVRSDLPGARNHLQRQDRLGPPTPRPGCISGTAITKSCKACPQVQLSYYNSLLQCFSSSIQVFNIAYQRMDVRPLSNPESPSICQCIYRLLLESADIHFLNSPTIPHEDTPMPTNQQNLARFMFPTYL